MNMDTNERNDGFFEELPDDALPDEPPAEMRKHPPENLKDAFLPSRLKDKSKYESDVRYPWLSLLMKAKAVTDPCVLDRATIRSSFFMLDKESSFNEQWRRVILRKFRKDAWEVLDEYGDTVLDTVLQTGKNGVANQWGKWFRAPTLDDYNDAIEADKQRKSHSEEKERELEESPKRKHIRDQAFESLAHNGRLMKKRAQNFTRTTF